MYILTVEERRTYETIAVNANNTLQARMEAHFWVGYCYAELTGGTVQHRTNNFVQAYRQAHRQAHRWWQRALELLGRLSADGGDEQEGPNDNTGKIRYRLKLYQDAIPRLQYESDNNGDDESRYYLAKCHYNGHGSLPRDKMMALTYYRLAAKGGHSKSSRELGCGYRHGSFGPKDNVRATFWYNKAIQQGDNVSQTFKQSLIRSLSSDEEREELFQTVQRTEWLLEIKLHALASNARANIDLGFDDLEQDDTESVPLAPFKIWPVALQKFGAANAAAGVSPSFLLLRRVLMTQSEFWACNSNRRRTA